MLIPIRLAVGGPLAYADMLSAPYELGILDIGVWPRRQGGRDS